MADECPYIILCSESEGEYTDILDTYEWVGTLDFCM